MFQLPCLPPSKIRGQTARRGWQPPEVATTPTEPTPPQGPTAQPGDAGTGRCGAGRGTGGAQRWHTAAGGLRRASSAPRALSGMTPAGSAPRSRGQGAGAAARDGEQGHPRGRGKGEGTAYPVGRGHLNDDLDGGLAEVPAVAAHHHGAALPVAEVHGGEEALHEVGQVVALALEERRGPPQAPSARGALVLVGRRLHGEHGDGGPLHGGCRPRLRWPAAAPAHAAEPAVRSPEAFPGRGRARSAPGGPRPAPGVAGEPGRARGLRRPFPARPAGGPAGAAPPGKAPGARRPAAISMRRPRPKITLESEAESRGLLPGM